MAPVELEQRLSLLPVAAFGGHIFLAASLTLLAIRAIFRSYLVLPPSQGTRRRLPSRKTHVKLFSALASLSLLTSVYWAYSFSDLSYRVWAAERGVELPESFFGEKGALRGGEHPGRFHLTRWLNDTPIYQDALEVVAEKARRFWWGQQIDLATISWSMLLAIEGRRRKIPHLWAFMTLAQIVNLSFAQNLFYVALLLTPVPLPDNVSALTSASVARSSSKLSSLASKIVSFKPDNWCPHPILYLAPLLASFTTIFLLPFASNTPSFMTTTILSRSLTFTPLILPYIVPETWGTVHPHPHDAHSAYTSLFRTISYFSLALHSKSTIEALLFNTPDSSYHRHSVLHPFKSEHRSTLSRSSTAFTKVLGAINDHPAVSAVGWDVILSGLSLGLWAAARSLDVSGVLTSSGLYYSNVPKSISEDIAAVANSTEKSIAKIKPASTRKRGRTSKLQLSASTDDADSTLSAATPGKRRGRPRKSAEKEEDKAYVPPETVQEEGDEEGGDEWEVGALAWGLVAAGGLGVGTGGVFGAETTGR